MAEVFGVAAGAIGVVSLSIQLAESLHKVKSFYASVKNAPPQVAELIEEIEIMQDILGDLETGSQGATVASSPTMRRCMKVADGATRRFTTFATELQTRIKKSKYRGGIKFALSRDDIKQMLDQLERTKSSLNLAYSLYQQATAEDRHVALMQAVTSSHGTAVQPAQTVKVSLLTQDATIPAHGGRQVSRLNLVTGKTLFKLTTPEWLSSTICQLEVTRSIVGLNCLVRTYGIVPYDAPVFKACRNGDIVGMQRLFDSGLVSPFDQRDCKGSRISLWLQAAAEMNIEVLRFLSQYNVASVEVDMVDTLAMFRCGASAATVGNSVREDMLWLTDLFEEADPPAGPIHDPFYSLAAHLLSHSKRKANSIFFWQRFENPMMSEKLLTLSKRYCQDMLSQYVPAHHDGRTPLHLFIFNLAYRLARNQIPVAQELETMVFCIIKSGADLHEADRFHTPLSLFLNYFPVECIGLYTKNLRRLLKVWLNILQRAGVSLIAYGAEESRRLQALCFLEKPLPQLWYRFMYRRYVFNDHVIYFTISYGPTPEDWTVQLDMVEQYAGDFWRMPGLLDETKVQAIPGSWIDT